MIKIQFKNQKLLYHAFAITMISSSMNNKISNAILNLKNPQVIYDLKQENSLDLQSNKYYITHDNNSKLDNASFDHPQVKELFLEDSKGKNKKQERNKNHIYRDKKIKEHDNYLKSVRTKSKDFHSTNLKSSSSLRDSSASVIINHPLTINELSALIMVPETEIIKFLFLKGIQVTINQTIGIDIAASLAKEYGFKILHEKYFSDITPHEVASVDNTNNVPRAPIITVTGSSSSGKTSFIRDLQRQENINIQTVATTQNIQGYEFDKKLTINNEKVVLIDTPGHEALKNMRNLSIKIADITILVIAATDGLNLTTRMIIQQIKLQSKPTLVILSKTDLVTENVINQLVNEIVQDSISNTKSKADVWMYSKNITQEQIKSLWVRLANLVEENQLLANPNLKAKGIVLNSYLDDSRGVIASTLIQNGTLKVGDFIVAEDVSGRVRVIEASNKKRLYSAKPSTIIEIWGFTAVPQVGSSIITVNSEKEAKKRIKQHSLKDGSLSSEQQKINRLLNNISSNFVSATPPERVNLIIKTSTQGVQEGIIISCAKITQPDVRLSIVSISVGKITDADIKLAIITKSIIIGFNTERIVSTQLSAQQAKAKIYNCSTIDGLISEVQNHVNQISSDSQAKKCVGLAIVESIFTLATCIVAGCIMKSGKITKNSIVEVIRNKEVIYNGPLNSLKHIKDDIVEAKEGEEFGMSIADFNEWELKDTVKIYATKPL